MKNFAIVTLSFSTLLIGLTTSMAAASSNSTGLSIVGQQIVNVLTFHRTKYEGDCPGVTMENPKAYFTSAQTPSGSRRRVRIENRTSGFTKTPYTDREYDSGNRSETTTLAFGASHSSKFLRIQPGENRFTYSITERKNLIESGEFTALVKLEEVVRQRNATWEDATVCSNSSVSADTCADLRSARQFVCPNGPVLKTRLLDQGNYYRTVLSNRSEQSIEVEVEVEFAKWKKYELYPGEAVSLQTPSSSASSLSVRYRMKDAAWQHVSVTPAKYMQFRENSHSKQIELVDFNRDDRSSYKFRDHSGGYRSEDCYYGKCEKHW